MLKVDAHQHFWQLERDDYDWLSPDLAEIHRDFLPRDIEAFIRGVGVDKTLVVQAAETVAETQFILDLAEQHDTIAGVVGWVDMESDQALETLAELRKSPYLVGIRPVIQDIPDPDWMLKSALDKVFVQLIEKGMTFDALVFPKHLGNLLTLIERYPSLKIVVDHGAKPEIARGNMNQWRSDMQKIAEHSNVYCKMSGLLTEAGGKMQDEYLFPYMNVLFDCFGEDRLMWGSDWPVLNLAADYQFWHSMCLRFLASHSEEAVAAIMGGNACRFYGLDPMTGKQLR